jgi:tetratricopeptide (TPR) repeat protein
MGRYAESISLMNRIPKLGSDLEVSFLDFLIVTLILAGKIEDAYEYIDALKADPKNYFWLAQGYILLDEYDSACVYLDSLKATDVLLLPTPKGQALFALSYWKTGKYYQAQEIINQLIIKTRTSSVGSPEYFLGWYYSGIGIIDSAFNWLEKAYENHSIEMPWLKVDPTFTNLKDDPRYWDLYERTGHKAYDDYLASKQP